MYFSLIYLIAKVYIINIGSLQGLSVNNADFIKKMYFVDLIAKQWLASKEVLITENIFLDLLFGVKSYSI